MKSYFVPKYTELCLHYASNIFQISTNCYCMLISVKINASSSDGFSGFGCGTVSLVSSGQISSRSNAYMGW